MQRTEYGEDTPVSWFERLLLQRAVSFSAAMYCTVLRVPAKFLGLGWVSDRSSSNIVEGWGRLFNIDWVADKALKLSYKNEETLLSTIYPDYGNLSPRP